LSDAVPENIVDIAVGGAAGADLEASRSDHEHAAPNCSAAGSGWMLWNHFNRVDMGYGHCVVGDDVDGGMYPATGAGLELAMQAAVAAGAVVEIISGTTITLDRAIDEDVHIVCDGEAIIEIPQGWTLTCFSFRGIIFELTSATYTTGPILTAHRYDACHFDGSGNTIEGTAFAVLPATSGAIGTLAGHRGIFRCYVNDITIDDGAYILYGLMTDDEHTPVLDTVMCRSVVLGSTGDPVYAIWMPIVRNLSFFEGFNDETMNYESRLVLAWEVDNLRITDYIYTMTDDGDAVTKWSSALVTVMQKIKGFVWNAPVHAFTNLWEYAIVELMGGAWVAAWIQWPVMALDLYASTWNLNGVTQVAKFSLIRAANDTANGWVNPEFSVISHIGWQIEDDMAGTHYGVYVGHPDVSATAKVGLIDEVVIVGPGGTVIVLVGDDTLVGWTEGTKIV